MRTDAQLKAVDEAVAVIIDKLSPLGVRNKNDIRIIDQKDPDSMSILKCDVEFLPTSAIENLNVLYKEHGLLPMASKTSTGIRLTFGILDKKENDGSFWFQLKNEKSGSSVEFTGSQAIEAYSEFQECAESRITFEWGGMQISTKDTDWKYRTSNTVGLSEDATWLMIVK
jgi:hypothetical protein